MHICFHFSLLSKSEIGRLHGRYIFNVIRNCRTFFQSDTVLYSYKQSKSSNCFTSLWTLGIISLFNLTHSSGCVVVSHYDLTWNFLWLKMLSLFLCTYLPSVYFLLWSVYSNFCQRKKIFCLLLSCKSLSINPSLWQCMLWKYFLSVFHLLFLK